MQISIVMLLFSDQISGRAKVFRGGGQTVSGEGPCERKPGLLKINNDTRFFFGDYWKTF